MAKKLPKKKEPAKKDNVVCGPKDGDGRIVEYMNDSYQAEMCRGGTGWVEIGPRVGDIKFAKQYIEDDRRLQRKLEEHRLLEMKKRTVRKVIDF